MLERADLDRRRGFGACLSLYSCFWGAAGGMGSGMVGGFNNNFRYRGILFHVQTEDSGVSNPHVVTHLFHGGNILSSEKLDYSGKLELGEDELEEVVRELMETQHKAMLKRLQRGLHDKVILERLGAQAFSEAAPSERSDTDAQLMGPDDDGSDTATAAGVTAEPALPPGPISHLDERGTLCRAVCQRFERSDQD